MRLSPLEIPRLSPNDLRFSKTTATKHGAAGADLLGDRRVKCCVARPGAGALKLSCRWGDLAGGVDARTARTRRPCHTYHQSTELNRDSKAQLGSSGTPTSTMTIDTTAYFPLSGAVFDPAGDAMPWSVGSGGVHACQAGSGREACGSGGAERELGQHRALPRNRV